MPLPPPVEGARWIPLPRGHAALVDEEDYERTMYFNWCSFESRGRRYAQSDSVSMHSFILGCKIEEIDHKNGNGLDNRKQNLRHCTKTQNMRNVRKTRSATSSKYKGVSFTKSISKWCAEITADWKRYNLGYYLIEEDAARVYDAKARELFGEFTNLNFPEAP